MPIRRPASEGARRHADLHRQGLRGRAPGKRCARNRTALAPTDGYGNSKAYALTKRSDLIKAGLPERGLRIAIVNTPSENRHVVLAVATDHGNLVLDNFDDDVWPWAKLDYDWIERQDDKGTTGWVMPGGGR